MADERPQPVDEVYEPPARVSDGAHISSLDDYHRLYERSLHDADAFWTELANEYIDWEAPFDTVVDEDLATGRIAWFLNGKLNVTTNCLDRHLESRGDKVAILWEGDEPGQNREITYRELQADVCRLGNELRARGVRKGDRVAIYMGMVPELAIAMLACARIGAVHSVIFGGFSRKSIADRVNDSSCKAIITQDEGLRGGRPVPLKKNVDDALESVDCVEFVIVYQHTGGDIVMHPERDIWWHESVPNQPAECAPEIMDAEDPLFILYTSGSTGMPKGVQHTQAGYLLYTTVTHKLVFDLREDDIYCCAADVGWITGHSYIVYGPLSNGATTVMFESVPNYPDAGRYWDMVDRLGITIFYTAPTALRALMREGDEFVKTYKRDSLRVLGTVGEPINPEAWRWYFNVVGDGRCSIVDTYWQTESGGHMLTGLAGATTIVRKADGRDALLRSINQVLGLSRRVHDRASCEFRVGIEDGGELVEGVAAPVAAVVVGRHQLCSRSCSGFCNCIATLTCDGRRMRSPSRNPGRNSSMTVFGAMSPSAGSRATAS